MPQLFAALVSLILFLVVNGCATFPGKDIPIYTFADLPLAPENKQCLVISDKCTKETCADIDAIIATFEKSGYFLKAPEHCTPKDDYKSNAMKMDFDWNFRTGPYLVDLVNHFISGFTFTILPARGRDYYVMTVQIKRNDQIVKQYVYRDHIERWIQLFYLFKRPEPDYSYQVALHEMYDRMVMNFLYDYARDVQKGEIFAGY